MVSLPQGMAKVTESEMELRSREEFRPSTGHFPDITIQRETALAPAIYREILRRVGEPWGWAPRIWQAPDEQLESHIGYAGLHLHVARRGKAIVGFFELWDEPEKEFKIDVFGLVPEEIGKGLGKWLLTQAVETAFALGAKRVWLLAHSDGHPHAMRNYLARGFKIVRTEEYDDTDPT